MTKKPTWSLLGINFALGIAGYMVFLNNGFPDRFPKHEEQVSSRMPFEASKKEERKSTYCNENFQDIELCLIASEDSLPTIALIGDSHANHWFPGVSKNLGEKNNLVVLAKSGTIPLINVKSKRNPDTDLDSELNHLLEIDSIHTIILSAFWSNYHDEKGTRVVGRNYKNVIYSPEVNDSGQQVIFRVQLEKTLEKILSSGKKVVFIHDIPTLDFELQACESLPFLPLKQACYSTLQNVWKKQESYRLTVEPILKKYNITSFDPLVEICKDDRCDVFKDKKYLFSDPHHLSIWGSEELSKNFSQLL